MNNNNNNTNNNYNRNYSILPKNSSTSFSSASNSNQGNSNNSNMMNNSNNSRPPQQQQQQQQPTPSSAPVMTTYQKPKATKFIPPSKRNNPPISTMMMTNSNTNANAAVNNNSSSSAPHPSSSNNNNNNNNNNMIMMSANNSNSNSNSNNNSHPVAASTNNSNQQPPQRTSNNTTFPNTSSASNIVVAPSSSSNNNVSSAAAATVVRRDSASFRSVTNLFAGQQAFKTVQASSRMSVGNMNNNNNSINQNQQSFPSAAAPAAVSSSTTSSSSASTTSTLRVNSERAVGSNNTTNNNNNKNNNNNTNNSNNNNNKNKTNLVINTSMMMMQKSSSSEIGDEQQQQQQEQSPTSPIPPSPVITMKKDDLFTTWNPNVKKIEQIISLNTSNTFEQQLLLRQQQQPDSQQQSSSKDAAVTTSSSSSSSPTTTTRKIYYSKLVISTIAQRIQNHLTNANYSQLGFLSFSSLSSSMSLSKGGSNSKSVSSIRNNNNNNGSTASVNNNGTAQKHDEDENKNPHSYSRSPSYINSSKINAAAWADAPPAQKLRDFILREHRLNRQNPSKYRRGTPINITCCTFQEHLIDPDHRSFDDNDKFCLYLRENAKSGHLNARRQRLVQNIKDAETKKQLRKEDESVKEQYRNGEKGMTTDLNSVDRLKQVFDHQDENLKKQAAHRSATKENTLSHGTFMSCFDLWQRHPKILYDLHNPVTSFERLLVTVVEFESEYPPHIFFDKNFDFLDDNTTEKNKNNNNNNNNKQQNQQYSSTRHTIMFNDGFEASAFLMSLETMVDFDNDYYTPDFLKPSSSQQYNNNNNNNFSNVINDLGSRRDRSPTDGGGAGDPSSKPPPQDSSNNNPKNDNNNNGISSSKPPLHQQSSSSSFEPPRKTVETRCSDEFPKLGASQHQFIVKPKPCNVKALMFNTFSAIMPVLSHYLLRQEKGNEEAARKRNVQKFTQKKAAVELETEKRIHEKRLQNKKKKAILYSRNENFDGSNNNSNRTVSAITNDDDDDSNNNNDNDEEDSVTDEEKKAIRQAAINKIENERNEEFFNRKVFEKTFIAPREHLCESDREYFLEYAISAGMIDEREKISYLPSKVQNELKKRQQQQVEQNNNNDNNNPAHNPHRHDPILSYATQRKVLSKVVKYVKDHRKSIVAVNNNNTTNSMSMSRNNTGSLSNTTSIAPQQQEQQQQIRSSSRVATRSASNSQHLLFQPQQQRGQQQGGNTNNNIINDNSNNNNNNNKPNTNNNTINGFLIQNVYGNKTGANNNNNDSQQQQQSQQKLGGGGGVGGSSQGYTTASQYRTKTGECVINYGYPNHEKLPDFFLEMRYLVRLVFPNETCEDFTNNVKLVCDLITNEYIVPDDAPEVAKKNNVFDNDSSGSSSTTTNNQGATNQQQQQAASVAASSSSTTTSTHQRVNEKPRFKHFNCIFKGEITKMEEQLEQVTGDYCHSNNNNNQNSASSTTRTNENQNTSTNPPPSPKRKYNPYLVSAAKKSEPVLAYLQLQYFLQQYHDIQQMEIIEYENKIPGWWQMPDQGKDSRRRKYEQLDIRYTLNSFRALRPLYSLLRWIQDNQFRAKKIEEVTSYLDRIVKQQQEEAQQQQLQTREKVIFHRMDGILCRHINSGQYSTARQRLASDIYSCPLDLIPAASHPTRGSYWHTTEIYFAMIVAKMKMTGVAINYNSIRLTDERARRDLERSKRQIDNFLNRSVEVAKATIEQDRDLKTMPMVETPNRPGYMTVVPSDHFVSTMFGCSSFNPASHSDCRILIANFYGFDQKICQLLGRREVHHLPQKYTAGKGGGSAVLSTNKEVLNLIRLKWHKEFPFVSYLLQFRINAKLRETYLFGLFGCALPSSDWLMRGDGADDDHLSPISGRIPELAELMPPAMKDDNNAGADAKNKNNNLLNLENNNDDDDDDDDDTFLGEDASREEINRKLDQAIGPDGKPVKKKKPKAPSAKDKRAIAASRRYMSSSLGGSFTSNSLIPLTQECQEDDGGAPPHQQNNNNKNNSSNFAASKKQQQHQNDLLATTKRNSSIVMMIPPSQLDHHQRNSNNHNIASQSTQEKLREEKIRQEGLLKSENAAKKQGFACSDDDDEDDEDDDSDENENDFDGTIQPNQEYESRREQEQQQQQLQEDKSSLMMMNNNSSFVRRNSFFDAEENSDSEEKLLVNGSEKDDDDDEPEGESSSSFSLMKNKNKAIEIIKKLFSKNKNKKLQQQTLLLPRPKERTAIRALHANWVIDGTASGRFACDEPNLMNIPRSDVDDNEDRLHQRVCRQSIVPLRDDHLIVTFDYNQVELRILAALSRDEKLIFAFKPNMISTHHHQTASSSKNNNDDDDENSNSNNNTTTTTDDGADIHKKVAALMFHQHVCNTHLVTSDERKKAKKTVYATLYGMGPQSLAADLSVEIWEAKKIQDQFWSSFTKVKNYREQLLHECRANGGVFTYHNQRFIPVEEANHPDSGKRSAGERKAFNVVIQGTAADVIKKSMVWIEKFLPRMISGYYKEGEHLQWALNHQATKYDNLFAELKMKYARLDKQEKEEQRKRQQQQQQQENNNHHHEQQRRERGDDNNNNNNNNNNDSQNTDNNNNNNNSGTPTTAISAEKAKIKDHIEQLKKDPDRNIIRRLSRMESSKIASRIKASQDVLDEEQKLEQVKHLLKKSSSSSTTARNNKNEGDANDASDENFVAQQRKEEQQQEHTLDCNNSMRLMNDDNNDIVINDEDIIMQENYGTLTFNINNTGQQDSTPEQRQKLIEEAACLPRDDDCFLVMMIHDELVFSIRRSKLIGYTKAIKWMMENACKFPGVELPVNVSVGPNYGDTMKMDDVESFDVNDVLEKINNNKSRNNNSNNNKTSSSLSAKNLTKQQAAGGKDEDTITSTALKSAKTVDLFDVDSSLVAPTELHQSSGDNNNKRHNCDDYVQRQTVSAFVRDVYSKV